jgi:hypothetical protein
MPEIALKLTSAMILDNRSLRGSFELVIVN